MIIYSENKKQFLEDISNSNIEDIILYAYRGRLNKDVSTSEVRSWQNSLREMYFILNDESIPDDVGVAVEYHIPWSGKRIDFIVTWQDENNQESVIIVELKQWTEAQVTNKDAVVITRYGRGLSERPHPSYQARSYAALLQGFNTTVYEENIQLRPCAYLHNYVQDNVITNDFYKEYLEKSPVFLKGQKNQLREFIKKYVKKWDHNKVMYRIENGEIRPSKMLSDSLSSMLKGNEEFVMIDEQKVVFETAMALAQKASAKNKHVFIVEWGPWTWKSVVAVNLLVKLTNKGLVAQYVTKNAAPRTVYQSKLTGTMRQTEIANMFVGSWAFTDCKPNTFDALIVDEAHRLNEKSGLYKNMWENQIKELINASKCTIFFIDENQKVTLSDIGEKDQIEKRAQKLWATVHYGELSSQFRCNGSDGYLSRLDNVLQIRETANDTLDDIKYDFQIVDSPETLKEMIREKNKVNNKARIVAWYCWDWISKKHPQVYDIVFLEHNFRMRRNLSVDGNLRILKPESVNEIWCIHTCQGLEVDYIGVIVWADLVVREGQVITSPDARAKTDTSLKWYKKLMTVDKEWTLETVDKLIKNTYRTLMTRGMKWCYVYFVDKETEQYFKSRMKVNGWT